MFIILGGLPVKQGKIMHEPLWGQKVPPNGYIKKKTQIVKKDTRMDTKNHEIEQKR